MYKKKIRHLFGRQHQLIEGFLHSLVEIGVTHVAPVDIEELTCAFLSGRIGTSYITSQRAKRGIDLHTKQLLTQFFSEQGCNTLLLGFGQQGNQWMVIVGKSKVDIGIYEGHALEFRYHVGKFGLVALQKLASCRYIEEKVLYLEITAGRTVIDLLCQHTTALNGQTGTQLCINSTRTQCYLRDSSNTRKCFSPKAHCRKAKKVCSLGYLARSMTLECQTGIRLRHTFTIVHDLYGSPASISNNHVYATCACVNGVLQ